MPPLVAHGTFASPAATGNQSVTGVGFQPKVLLFYWTRRTADGSQAHAEMGFGAATSSAARWAISISSEDARSTTSRSRQSWSDVDCIRHVLFSGLTQFRADFVSMDADGFTVNWTNVQSGVLIRFIAFGGDDLTGVFVGSRASPTSTGTTSGGFTGVGFQPDLVLLFPQPGATTGSATTTNSARFGIGAATPDGQWALGISSHNGQATSVTKRVLRSDRCVHRLGESGAVDLSGSWVSMDADGFTLDFSVIDGGRIAFLALQGGKYGLGTFLQPTSTGVQNVPTPGVLPHLAMLASINAPSDTGIQDHCRFSFGAGISATNRSSIWTGDKHDVATTECDSNTDAAAILRMMTEGTPTTEAVADLDGFAEGELSLDWEQADAVQREIAFVVLGEEAEATAKQTRDTVQLRDRVTAALRDKFGGRFDAQYGFLDSLSGELSEHMEGEFSDAFGFSYELDGILSPNLSAEMSDAFGFTDSVAASGGSIDGDLADMRSPNLVAPLTITPRSGDPIHVAPQAIRHPDRFYEGRIRTFGIFSRSVPAPSGIVRLSDASAEIIDNGSDLRERFAPKTMRKARVELRIGPEGGSYSAFLRPMLREIADVRFRDGIIIPEFRDVAFDFFKEEVDPFITRENFPNLPENPQSQFGNIIVGVVHSALGAILCPLVDPASGLYLAARHLLPSVDEVFRKRREDDEAVPFSGFTVVEQEVDGHLRTFLQIPNQELDTLIFANITGVDLRRPSQQVREILLTARDLTGRINFASFEETLAKETALGYFSDGAFTEPITFGEAATQILRSFQEDLYTDIFDRLSINLTTGDDVPAMALDDVLHHHEATVEQTLAEPTYNVIPYRYGRDYARRKWHQETEFFNEVDVDAIGERVKAPEINMWFVRDDITARAVAEDYASYYDLDAFRIHGEIPLIPTVERIEPTDLVDITHFGGIAPSPGYRREVFKITDLDMDIPRLKYRYKAIRRVQFEGAMGFLAGTTAHNSRFGPFLPSAGFGGDGRMYSILRDPDDEKILRAWGTRDWGATWVMLDESNSPTFENDIASYDAHFNDSFKTPPLGSPGHIPGQLDEILCACQEGVTARVSYSRFDLRSEKWVVSDRPVFTPDPTPVNALPLFPLYVSVTRIRQSPYTQAIFFDGEPQTVENVLVRRGMVTLSFDGGSTWTDPVYVAARLTETGSGGHPYRYRGGRAIAGSGGLLHFFYERAPGDFAGDTPDQVVRTMDLAGLTGTPTTGQLQSRLGAERKWWETNLTAFSARLNVGNYQTYTYDFDEEGNELPAHTGQRHILLPIKGSSGRPMLFNFVSRPEIVFADAHRGLAEGVEFQNLAFGNVSEDIATGLGDTLNPSIVARLFPTRLDDAFRTMRAVMSIVGNPSWTVYKERRHSPTDTDQNALLPSSGTWFPSIDGTCQLDTSPPENVPCARLFKAGPTRPFSTAEVRRVGAEFITGVLPRPSEVWMATMQFVRQWDAAEAVIGRSTNFWIFEMLKVHGKEEDIPLPEDPQWTIDRWLECLQDDRRPHDCRFDLD